MVATAVVLSPSTNPIVINSSEMLNVRFNTSVYSSMLSSLILMLNDATEIPGLNKTPMVFDKEFNP